MAVSKLSEVLAAMKIVIDAKRFNYNLNTLYHNAKRLLAEIEEDRKGTDND